MEMHEKLVYIIIPLIYQYRHVKTHAGRSCLIASFEASPHVCRRGACACQGSAPRCRAPLTVGVQADRQPGTQFGDITALTEWGFRFTPVSGPLCSLVYYSLSFNYTQMSAWNRTDLGTVSDSAVELLRNDSELSSCTKKSQVGSR